MAGQRQHDRIAFVDRAMHSFWMKGYEGTSMADLVAATGVNRGSIYAGFSGKRDLFLATLDRYDDIHRRRFLDRLSAADDPLEAIGAAFRAAAGIAPADAPDEHGDENPPQPDGCLLVNTAIEMAPHDAEIAVLIAESLAGVEAFFRGRLEAAAATGRLRAGTDIAGTAAALLALFLGLRVLARSGADEAVRAAVVARAGAMLK
jgi:TetR/AcrR family transcriptional repressor of nem operon